MPVLSNPQPQPQPAAPATSAVDVDATTLVDRVDEPTMVPPDTPSTPATPPPADDGPRRRSSLVPLALGVGALGAAAVGIALVASGDDDVAEEAVTQVRAVSAEVRDLTDFSELDGRMVYANTDLIASSSDGVVTDVAAEGTVLDRGDTAYEINTVPVTVFFGDAPLYRPLQEGVVGDDVELLEANLASLGYHTEENEEGDDIDTGFVVDGVYDAATTAAVLRWQNDIGVSPTGTVAPPDVVVVPGPATVTDVAVESGDRIATAGPLMEVNTSATVTGEYIQHSGEIDLFIDQGFGIQSGFVIYAVDERPIVGFATDVDMDRTLEAGIEDGDDVMVLEEALAAIGYDADGDLDVDDEWDEFTTQAVVEYQEDLQETFEDLDVDGRLTLDEFIVFEPGTTVGALNDLGNDVVPNGTPLWTDVSESASRVVETEIEVAEQDKLAQGNVVDVEFPNGEIVQGVVTDVANSSTVDPMDPDAEPVLAVEIELDQIPDSAATLNELDVEVLLVESVASGVVTVPVGALVSTGDGGYAVEAVTSGGGTQFVAVEPGMFSDGFVEVSGIQAGTQVVIPS